MIICAIDEPQEIFLHAVLKACILQKTRHLKTFNAYQNHFTQIHQENEWEDGKMEG